MLISTPYSTPLEKKVLSLHYQKEPKEYSKLWQS